MPARVGLGDTGADGQDRGIIERHQLALAMSAGLGKHLLEIAADRGHRQAHRLGHLGRRAAIQHLLRCQNFRAGQRIGTEEMLAQRAVVGLSGFKQDQRQTLAGLLQRRNRHHPHLAVRYGNRDD